MCLYLVHVLPKLLPGLTSRISGIKTHIVNSKILQKVSTETSKRRVYVDVQERKRNKITQ